MSTLRIVLAAFAVAFLAGFGWGRGVGVPWQPDAPTELAVAATVPPVDGGTPTVAVATDAPAGRVPTPADPLRVILAGDSVMAGLAPAMEAALESGGTADVRFVLTPTILRDPTIRFTWERQLEEFDPEVVVMFVGTWESRVVEDETGRAVGMSEAGWRPAYEQLIVDPWIDLITAGGADVLWIGSPVVADASANLLFAGLNAVYADLPARFAQVRYLDATRALQEGRTDGFEPVGTDADGRPVRTRQIDGLHLCPAGAERLATAAVAELAPAHGIAVAAGWELGSWQDDPEVYPADGCPAP